MNIDLTPKPLSFPDPLSDMWKMHREQLVALQRIEMQLQQLVSLQRETLARLSPPGSTPG